MTILPLCHRSVPSRQNRCILALSYSPPTLTQFDARRFPSGVLDKKAYGVCMDDVDTPLVHTELTHRVLRVMHRRKECAIEELMQECSSYTWNQVLLEIDRLSRSGELCLLYKKDGDYAVRLPRAA